MYYGIYQRLNLHVSATPKQVLRALYKKLKPGSRKRTQREHRHFIARLVLTHHCDARALFARYRFLKG
jgi:hypothetical protein